MLMPETTDDRATLRRMLRERRRAHVMALPASIRALCFHALPAPLLARLPQGGAIALYAAKGDEAPTDAIALQLAARGLPLALPALENREAPMTFRAWTPGDPLADGPYGIRQPGRHAELVDPVAIIVPLLGFDTALGRIGQGGGHYDRALAARPAALRIGLAWSVQQVDVVPMASWDQPMDMIVTEQRFFERSAPR